MNEKIHIVCLDAPSPADYGGAIDMYYTILALAETGKKLILHYFNYNEERGHKGLEPYCEEVYRYERKSFLSSFHYFKPYIVGSRINKKLVERLNRDDYPVILEGIHCTGILPYLKKGKKVTVRVHNDEAIYYYRLAKSETGLLKRLYFHLESRLLKSYQSKLPGSLPLACLSEKDRDHFRELGFSQAFFVPCFIPWQQLKSKTGHGLYCLYHGNMRVRENEAAAIWLIKNIFSEISVPLIIAGKGISSRVINASARYPHIKIVNNPTIAELDTLVQNAHINVLPSMNETGVKLKLLHALLEGRFCIANYKGVWGSGIESAVSTVEANSGWMASIMAMMNTDFTESLLEERKKILSLYNNKLNAEKISEGW